jgi:hypothetical protein
MRRGPFVLALFVALALSAFSTTARADGDLDNQDECVRGEPEALRSEAPTPPAPVASLPTDAQLCVRGGLGIDCQMHDPAEGPVPPAPSAHTLSDLASAPCPDVPALPELKSARAPLPPGVLGAPRPGFDRELFRPPRA